MRTSFKEITKTKYVKEGIKLGSVKNFREKKKKEIEMKPNQNSGDAFMMNQMFVILLKCNLKSQSQNGFIVLV